MKHKLVLVIVTALLLMPSTACGDGQSESSTQGSETLTEANETPQDSGNTSRSAAAGEVAIKFDYEKISGMASNQFAIWIEDMDGNYVNTLYATRWTANGGYESRPDSIASWVSKSKLASMPKAKVDAIAGATPNTGNLSYSWDLTDADGESVQSGEYKFFVEGTLRWKNHVVYSGVIALGDAPMTIDANMEFVYEASDGQAALTGESPENAMIGAVTASFVPAADN